MSIPFLARPVGLLVDHSQPLGVLGVELFFVLSGFLIGKIIIADFMSGETFSFRKVSDFWIRRWFRTLPVYWLILTLNIILYSLLHQQVFTLHTLSYYPFFQNILHPYNGSFFNESWSLSVEEWFYITMPFALYISAILFRPQNKDLFLFRVFIYYLLAFAAIRLFNAFSPINGADQDNGIRKIVVFRLDAVMYGVLFAYFNTFRYALFFKHRTKLLFIGLTGIITLFYLISKRSFHIYSSPSVLIRFVSNAFLYLLLPLFFSLCLPYANSISRINNRSVSGIVVFISKISYSMYLTHYSLIYLLFFYRLNHPGIAATIMLYILYWAIVVFLSSFIYFYFERPLMNLRDKVAPSNRIEVSLPDQLTEEH